MEIPYDSTQNHRHRADLKSSPPSNCVSNRTAECTAQECTRQTYTNHKTCKFQTPEKTLLVAEPQQSFKRHMIEDDFFTPVQKVEGRPWIMVRPANKRSRSMYWRGTFTTLHPKQIDPSRSCQFMFSRKIVPVHVPLMNVIFIKVL